MGECVDECMSLMGRRGRRKKGEGSRNRVLSKR